MGTTTATRPGSKVRLGGAGAPPGARNGADGHHGGGQPPGGPGASGSEEHYDPRKYTIAAWVVVVGVLMLFLSLASAYVVRKTAGLSTQADWVPLSRPRILWVNTAVILASSLAFELAKRALRQIRLRAYHRWMALTGILGIAFLAGQFKAWREFAAQGIYLKTHPHSSFFYMLTSLHAIHLLGGLAALAFVGYRGLKTAALNKHEAVVRATSIYWHFMGALWVFLFILIFFTR